MSFSSEVKTELCKNQISGKCCAVAELYGVFLYCNTLSDSEIRIVTGSQEFAKRLPKLMKKAFGIGFDSVFSPEKSGKKIILSVSDPEKLAKIFSAYGHVPGVIFAHHINFGVLEEDCCKHSFVRGAFLAGGSVTDPQKSYHLEMVTAHYNVSREMQTILMELGFYAKSISRNGNYITYFKQSETVEDLLTSLGAPVAAMQIMSIKIEKDMHNSVNRRVNCDTANVSKTVEASAEQVDAIRKLEQAGALETLPEKLRETAQRRYENPELSLTELAATFTPPLTKSCLNHRLKKLVLMAQEL